MKRRSLTAAAAVLIAVSPVSSPGASGDAGGAGCRIAIAGARTGAWDCAAPGAVGTYDAEADTTTFAATIPTSGRQLIVWAVKVSGDVRSGRFSAGEILEVSAAVTAGPDNDAPGWYLSKRVGEGVFSGLEVGAAGTRGTNLDGITGYTVSAGRFEGTLTNPADGTQVTLLGTF